jgi:nucleotide-binding universal stress UspA family protein
VDEHQGGRDAITLAKRLVERDGELTLAFVYSGDTRTWRGSSAAYDATERERAFELLRKAREESDIAAELLCAGAPSAGGGLHLPAEAAGADLLVVGSSRRGLLGRVLLEDDTRAALNGALYRRRRPRPSPLPHGCRGRHARARSNTVNLASGGVVIVVACLGLVSSSRCRISVCRITSRLVF